MASLHYLNSKISDALYILTVHEGDACTRLARVLPKLRILSPASFPENIRDDFQWVQHMLNKGYKNPIPNVLPAKLTGIQNRTARKVIEKLIFIQDRINQLVAESTQQH